MIQWSNLIRYLLVLLTKRLCINETNSKPFSLCGSRTLCEQHSIKWCTLSLWRRRDCFCSQGIKTKKQLTKFEMKRNDFFSQTEEEQKLSKNSEYNTLKVNYNRPYLVHVRNHFVLCFWVDSKKVLKPKFLFPSNPKSFLFIQDKHINTVICFSLLSLHLTNIYFCV